VIKLKVRNITVLTDEDASRVGGGAATPSTPQAGCIPFSDACTSNGCDDPSITCSCEVSDAGTCVSGPGCTQS
jgi:hypothetical protein